MACNAIATASATIRLLPEQAIAALVALAKQLRPEYTPRVHTTTGDWDETMELRPGEILVTTGVGGNRLWFWHNTATGETRASEKETFSYANPVTTAQLAAQAANALYVAHVAQAIRTLQQFGATSNIKRTNSGAITLTLTAR